MQGDNSVADKNREDKGDSLYQKVNC